MYWRISARKLGYKLGYRSLSLTILPCIYGEIINNKREVIIAADIKRYRIYFALALIVLSLSIWIFLVIERAPNLPNMINLALFSSGFAFLSFFIANIKNITAKVFITENGIEYCDIFTKIICTWENIRQIEVISQEHRSEEGKLIEIWSDYKIYTKEQKFSLNSRANLDHSIAFWKDGTLRKSIFEKITSQNPKIQIININGIIQDSPLDYSGQR